MIATIVRGRVDIDGVLVAADAPLLRLQQLAGADLGSTLAMPQLVRLVGLAMRNGVEILRPLILGDNGRTISGQANIRPHGDGADILIRDWHYVVMASGRGDIVRMSGPSDMGWSWESDAELKLLALRIGPVAPPVPMIWVAKSLGEVLELLPDEAGEYPLLNAHRQQRVFANQHILAIGDSLARHEMILAGMPLFDAMGRFAGFRGTAEPAPDMDMGRCPHFQTQEDNRLELRFNKRVDEALRVPINRIIASAESIAGQFEGPVRADYARYAGDIANAGRHLLGLVDDLADVQHIEKPDFTVAADAIDLGDLARRAAGLLAMKAEEKNIRITTPSVDAYLPATGEFRRVLQVLINLLTNAVRYSPSGTEIALYLEQRDGMASINVRDQGLGIAAEQQAVMFDKFERLGRRDSGGSGLGLYIARKLARAMGGDLQVDSEVGKGAKFMLSLPMRGNT